MSNWPYKTIDENMYKMHELYGMHPQKISLIHASCECGLKIMTKAQLNEDEKLSLIENLAIGNPWYINIKNNAQIQYIAKQLLSIKYPFHLPIHPSLAAYIVALNYLHNINECNAKILAIAFSQQSNLFESLLIHWNIYKPNVKDEIINSWKINGNYLTELLNLD